MNPRPHMNGRGSRREIGLCIDFHLFEIDGVRDQQAHWTNNTSIRHPADDRLVSRASIERVVLQSVGSSHGRKRRERRSVINFNQQMIFTWL